MNRAFTLAESLITLGIIGIIAVSTIPVIIGKYQEKVTVEKLKATSSIMSQALKTIELDEGIPSQWGLSKKRWDDEADKCNEKGSNGYTCSAWIMQYENMDYLHK